MKKLPPKFFLRLFKWYCHPRLHPHIEGDLLEVYGLRLKKSGKRAADIRFAIDVLLLFRPGIVRPAEGYQKLNSFGMYKSYFKVGWRNLLRTKGYSLINISGLAVGMAAAMLNGLWIWHEVSYDKYFENYDRVAMVAEEGNDPDRGKWLGVVMTYPLSTSLTTEYGQHFKRIARCSWNVDEILSYGEVKTSAKGLYVEEAFPEIFSLRMISGTRTALRDPQAILISNAAAKRMFGDEDPMGKGISINNKINVTVAGVFEDFPDNTQFNGQQFLSTWHLFEEQNKWINERALNDWRNHFLKIYVELPEANAYEKTAALVADALKFAPEDAEAARSREQHLSLYPMERWHLHPPFLRTGQIGPMFLLRLVAIVGIFILLLACINFVNLSTARAEKRAKEVGIRKSIGSVRFQLIQQFFSESLVVVFLAFVMAVLFVYVCLPGFNIVASKNMVMPWTNAWFWLIGISFVFFTGVLAGTWPALHLSSFSPVKALKGAGQGRGQATPRKILVVFQFSISVVLIIGTIVVYQQIHFVKARPVGYNRDGLLVVRKKNADFDGKYHVLRNELINSGAVLEVSESMGSMAEVASGNGGWQWKGHDPKIDKNFATLSVSHLHGKTVGWQFTQGRDFDPGNPADSSGLVINESALEFMKLNNPVGEPVTWTWWMDKSKMLDYKIIGVVKDMVMESPYAPSVPTLFYLKGFNGNPNVINIRVNPDISMNDAIDKIENAFRKVIPTAPFEYKFADEEYAQKFGKEERIGRLAGIFSFIAVFISFLGLVGLSSFVAEQRTKEIGIRKVLGATVVNVWRMLSKDFVILVMVSCLVASPLAYYLLSQWLQNFAYRTEIPWWVFVLTGSGAIVVTLCTVSYQAIKTALMNPVESLRSE